MIDDEKMAFGGDHGGPHWRPRGIRRTGKRHEASLVNSIDRARWGGLQGEKLGTVTIYCGNILEPSKAHAAINGYCPIFAPPMKPALPLPSSVAPAAQETATEATNTRQEGYEHIGLFAEDIEHSSNQGGHDHERQKA